jgi:hypothetical protein
VVGALLTAVGGILGYFRFQSRRDRKSAVGAAFDHIVDSLASPPGAGQATGGRFRTAIAWPR